MGGSRPHIHRRIPAPRTEERLGGGSGSPKGTGVGHPSESSLVLKKKADRRGVRSGYEGGCQSFGECFKLLFFGLDLRVLGGGRSLLSQLQLECFMKGGNRDYASLSGLFKPGRKKGPCFLWTHEAVLASFPRRSQMPILMAKTLPVSKKSSLADPQKSRRFFGFHLAFSHQENRECSLHLLHGFGVVPKLVGPNDLVFGKDCGSRHSSPPWRECV